MATKRRNPSAGNKQTVQKKEPEKKSGAGGAETFLWKTLKKGRKVDNSRVSEMKGTKATRILFRGEKAGKGEATQEI